MVKKKIVKKQKFCLEDMSIVKSKKDVANFEHKPSAFFTSHEKVGKALLQSLEENDADAFLEILDVYLKVNCSLK